MNFLPAGEADRRRAAARSKIVSLLEDLYSEALELHDISNRFPPGSAYEAQLVVENRASIARVRRYLARMP